jgi:predicted DsbA family dithiol-disulfide isomerase
MNVLSPARARLQIQVVHDLVCPWCYIGLRRLKRALASRLDIQAELSFHPFLLNPDMPRAGIARADYNIRRFGGTERAQRVHAGISEAGLAEGINFRFDLIRRTPSSVDAHRLVRFAAGFIDTAALIETLFAAYFTEGRDIGDSEELTAIAARHALPVAAVQQLLAGNEGTEKVHEDNLNAHRLGISGVPCFVIAGTHAIAGAQEPEVISRLFDVAMAESGVRF